MNPSTPAYYRHRFPSQIISHCVWLYFRFTLSFRDVEEMMNERGVTVSCNRWCEKNVHGGLLKLDYSASHSYFSSSQA